MNITSVKVRSSPATSASIAVASITIDDELIINDIKVYFNQSTNTYRIVFPNNSIAQQHGKKNIVLRSYNIRQQITDRIIEEFRKSKGE